MKNSQFSIWLKVFFMTILFITSQISLTGQTVICPKEKIGGFDSEYTWAKATLRKTNAETTTSDIKNATIFITYKSTSQGDFMYFHSNYKPVRYPYPIKIATNESLYLRLIASNIINIDGAHFEFAEAFQKQIKFIVDYRIFHHGKFKNLDFGKAMNIEIMDARGIVHADGFKILKTQKELKKMGYYKGFPDGISGKETDASLTAFRKAYSLEKDDKIFIYTRDGRKVVSYDDPDDFLKKFETLGEGCGAPLSICVDNDLVASFVLECNGQSIEFSTEGDISLTASYNGETYSATLNQKEKASEKNYSDFDGNNTYEDPVNFLKYYQSSYDQNKNVCENAVKLCLGKDKSISFEINCDGNKASVSTSGHVSVSSKDGRGRSIQF